MIDSLMEVLAQLTTFVDGFLYSHPVALLIVAGYLMVNILLFALTKGKEFAIAGYAGALFLIPFLKFG